MLGLSTPKVQTIKLLIFCFRFVSIVTVFVNKALLSGNDIKLDAPIFIAWFQCVVSALICSTLAQLSSWFPNVFYFPKGNPFNGEVLRKVFATNLNNLICIWQSKLKNDFKIILDSCSSGLMWRRVHQRNLISKTLHLMYNKYNIRLI